MKCSRTVTAESKNAATSVSSILCRSSCRDHESEIIANPCNIAQLHDHFRSILAWGLVHKSRRAMTADAVFLTIAVTGVVFLLEIGIFILAGMI